MASAGSGGESGGAGGIAGEAGSGGAGGLGGEVAAGAGGGGAGGQGGAITGGSGGDGGTPACGGEGEACDTGLPGSCADGVIGCQDGGPLCVPRRLDGCTPEVPLPVEPRSGAYTGSVFAPGSLRPSFGWTTSNAATDYLLELDDSCVPGEVRTCTFPSPETSVFVPARAGAHATLAQDLPVPSSAPVGHLYAWRVRACQGQACSAWSVPRALHVGQLPDDFDGDGFADALLPSPDRGELDVRYHDRVETVHGEDAGALTFGRSVAAAGDVDGDGFSDALVGGSLTRTSNVAFLLLGGADGLSAARTRRSAHGPGDYGAVVAGGFDLNGDGLDDMAVSDPENDSVSVLFGSSRAGPTPLVGPQRARFGASLAPAYLENGEPGLLVGAPFFELGEGGDLRLGAVFVYRGTEDGVGNVAIQRIDNPETVTTSKDFGLVIASTPRGPGGAPAYAVSAHAGGQFADRILLCTTRGSCEHLDGAGTAGASLAFVHDVGFPVDALAAGDPAQGKVRLAGFALGAWSVVDAAKEDGASDLGAAVASGDYAGTGAAQLLVGSPAAGKAFLFSAAGLRLVRQTLLDLAGIGRPLARLDAPPGSGALRFGPLRGWGHRPPRSEHARHQGDA